MNKEIRRVIVVLVMICVLFVSLMVYLTYFQVFRAESVKMNSYNKRLWINEEKILRGSIIDRNGKILAYSEKDGETYKRVYNYGNLYGHIIGYSYRELGKAGLELRYNNELLNISKSSALNELKNIVAPNTEGNTLKLTIDHHLQELSRSLLQGKKGAIVAMNPTTGEIYSMVSMPDFNPSALRESWSDIVEDENSPLLNRAISGLYQPGSTFKVITAIAAIETGTAEKGYTCKGSTTIGGAPFSCYNKTVHGNLQLTEALVKSCNLYFAEKGVEVGIEKLEEVSERFYMNKTIPFDLPVVKSSFPNRMNMDKASVAAASMGQGEVLISPLNMAMIASAIANNGEVVKPILVKEIISPEGSIVDFAEREVLSNGTDGFTASELTNMMVEVVQRGTGKNARISGVKVAGKTGTAENHTGKDHAWFIGFAPADNPKVALAVVLEEEGSSGGTAAAPIAKKIILEALNTIE
ncbi:MAG: penicillin-binding protein A [Tissierellia bacterium]|nr:penicillin-binding protein A [Tissierellia bacterium]